MSRTGDSDAMPRLLPTPHSVGGIDTVVSLLSAGWTYSAHPEPGFAALDADTSDWASIVVPGEPATQGFDVESDVEAGYRLTLPAVSVPADCRVVLRFDGVYNDARIWLNGELVGSHLGGFTRFECDVTTHIRADADNILTVGVTDRSDSVSTASNYAFHCIGGILRPVSLMVIPITCIEDLRVTTPVDEAGNAELVLDLRLGGDEPDAVVGVELIDPDGAAVDLGASAGRIKAGPDGSIHLEFPMIDARLWSDERPTLYELRITVGGARPVTYRQRVGFRTVEVRGNVLLVNGRPTLLRGVNRHDLDPRSGRSTDGTLERRDLELFRDANINFVRTSHYPPHPALLEAADELGIYIEVENGVCWAGQFGWPATQDDPRFLPEYVGPLAEMIVTARNHPSVIIWSIGNESTWGENFARSHELAGALDDSRPIIMSFHGGPEDILSSHYPLYGADLGSPDKPLLHDEVVHVPVYQSGDLRRDPGIHADWAESIADFVERLRLSDGGIGLAIWSGVDEQFALPTGTVGFGPWGLIDVWRRRKPEWWAVRSAYSPVRLAIGGDRAPARGGERLVVGNTYAVRNLSEITFEWHLSDGTSIRTFGPGLAPGERGSIQVPAGAVSVAVLDGERILDHRMLAGDGVIIVTDGRPMAGPRLSESDESLMIIGHDDAFRLTISRTSGLITSATVGDSEVIVHGPRPVIEGVPLPGWHAETVDASADQDSVTVRVRGSAGALRAGMALSVDGAGSICIDYTLDVEASTATGRVLEAGLELHLAADATITDWDAVAPGAITGEGYLRRPRGEAHRDALADPHLLGDDTVSWNDVRTGSIDHSARDRWSRDFRASRTAVRRQRVTDRSGAGVEVLLDGRHSTRLGLSCTTVRPDDARVRLQGPWEYREVAGGLNQGASGTKDHRCDAAGGRAVIRFTGAAIDCVGALGPDLGIIDVTLDGVRVGEADLFSPVDCSGHVFFSADRLGDGEHELEFQVTGRRHAWSTGTGARLRGFDVFAEKPHVILGLLAKRIYPVSGSFDWIDPAVVEPADDGVHASGTVTIRLLPSAERAD